MKIQDISNTITSDTHETVNQGVEDIKSFIDKTISSSDQLIKEKIEQVIQKKLERLLVNSVQNTVTNFLNDNLHGITEKAIKKIERNSSSYKNERASEIELYKRQDRIEKLEKMVDEKSEELVSLKKFIQYSPPTYYKNEAAPAMKRDSTGKFDKDGELYYDKKMEEQGFPHYHDLDEDPPRPCYCDIENPDDKCVSETEHCYPNDMNDTNDSLALERIHISEMIRKEFAEGSKDIKQGRTYSSEQVREMLNLNKSCDNDRCQETDNSEYD